MTGGPAGSDRGRLAASGPERWRRVQDLLGRALELPSGERSALLDRECGTDDALRREVMSLLEAHDRVGPLDRLAEQLVSPAAAGLREQRTGFDGRVIGQYVVLEPIGAGGMGVVYRARDERLARTVALKFLPPHLGASDEAKRRFLVEARAAAALEHPNVCTIHEIGESLDGLMFIAMPLYDGETLQVRLARGPLPVSEAVAIGRQIASGLEAAHAAGIVHRDVKPSNVMLLRDGRVKVLDFGIAKVEDVTLTASGVAVGTMAYMSPEQARGGRVDYRTDLWSLGVVLYEMLAGTRPFTGPNAAAVLHAILTHVPPPIDGLRPDAPAALRDILDDVLQRDPDRRRLSMQALVSRLAALEYLPPGSERPISTVRSSVVQAVPPRDDDDTSVPPTAERRRIAVLSVALCDYDALVEQLAPAELSDLVALLRETAVDVTRRHGGIVNQALAEEIVALFGIPTGHEDDDLRAVRAAIELHERARGIATPATARRGQGIALQTGIESGSAVAQRLREGPRRFGVTGGPMQVAARLAAAAAPGAILLGPDCAKRVNAFVQTETLEPIRIQPGAPAVAPQRVLGDSGHRSRIEAAEQSGLTPYTGRVMELSVLEAHVTQACGGEGRLVLVLGEAGMGKSRLLHEVRQRLDGSGMHVYVGRCPSYGGVEPYLAFVEVLREALGIGSDGVTDAREVAQRTREIDPSLEPFIPLCLHLLSIQSDEFAVPKHLHAEHLQAALLDALSSVVAALARRAPTLLLLEDWHWADAGSRAALSRIAEIVDAHPLAVLVTTRPEPAIVAELSGRGAVVQLAPLDRSGAAAILRAVLEAETVGDDLVSRVHERTAGNPFFIEQVGHRLLEEGAVAVRGGEAVLTQAADTLGLPDTVEAVIRARLDQLDGDTREVLRVASVVGREFSRDLLLPALAPGMDPAGALERLRAAGLIQQTAVTPAPLYRFKHVLTHEVAYGSLLDHQRRALHAAVGRALERQAAGSIEQHAELLAHHFSRAESWEEAVRYGRLAAERLRGLSQYAEALAILERVQQWTGQLPEADQQRDVLADVLLAQERLCETLGQRGRQQQIISALIALLAPSGTSERLAAAYLRQGDLFTLLKRFDAADRSLATVLRLSREWQDANLERSALRSLGLLRWHEGRHEEALAIAERSLAINRSLDDRSGMAGDLSNVGNILRSLRQHERARAILEEALELASDDALKKSYILHNLANVYRATGRIDKALELLTGFNQTLQLNLMPIQRSFYLTTIAHIHLQLGRTDEALRIYEEAVALSRRARHADGLAQALRLLGELQFALRQDGPALKHLSEAASLFAQLEDREAEAQAWSNVAAIHERTGAWGAGADAWTSTRALRQALDDREGELDALEGLARCERHLSKDPGAAIRKFEEALALAGAVRAGRREAALRNTLGILEWERGRYDRALAHYEAALRQFRADGDRVHEGLILNSLGVTLQHLARHEEARTALEQGIEVNRETGERLLEAHGLAALGDVSRALGRPDAARHCYERSLALRRELGDQTGERAMLDRIERVKS